MLLCIVTVFMINCMSTIIMQSLNREALISFKLYSVNLDTNRTGFRCYPPIWNFTGHCDFKIFVFGCSHSLTRLSAVPIFKDNEKDIYHLRYSTKDAERVNNLTYSYFSDPAIYTCNDNQKSIPVIFESMEKSFDNLTHPPHLNITTNSWSQRVIFWIQIWSNDVINMTDPKIWFAEFIENDKLLPFPENETNHTLEREANAFGIIRSAYAFHNLQVKLEYSWNYNCTNKGFGPICSTMCKESISTTCDKYTGQATCSEGYIGVLQKTYEVFLPYIYNCSSVDTCFNVTCPDDEVCIRFPVHVSLTVCRDYKTGIEPIAKCIPVGEKVKCVLIGTLPPNVNITASWRYFVLDDGAIISGEFLEFSEAAISSEPYECVITFDDFIPKQSISNNFTFMVYDDSAIIHLNIENEFVYLGQMLICSSEGWNPELVNYTMYAGDPDTLILDRIEQNMYEVNIKSQLGMNSITCLATLSFNCANKDPYLRSITMPVFVAAFQKLEWYGGERNIFYRGIDENPFQCTSSLPTNAANINVTIMQQPKITENNVILNETLVPGIYYAACTLELLDTNHSFTIYKYIHIHYFPNQTELTFEMDSNTYDSRLQCLPIPYPVEDYDYSITIFSSYNNLSVVGTYNRRSLERFPYDGSSNGEYLIKCTMKPKYPGRYEMIEKTFRVKLSEWKHPIVLIYMNWRVWSQVFYASLLIMITVFSLSWIIHMKSMSCISGDYLTKRTKVLFNLKRRNKNFYNKLIEWMEATNSYFYTIGIIPLSVTEAYQIIRTEPNITRDFFQYISGMKINANDIKVLNEKSNFYQKTIENLRKANK